MSNDSPLIFSYLALRKTIGILGIALPFVLFLGAYLIFQTGIQSSLSSYYHTEMRDVFVGTLFVIGFFLFAYIGYDLADKIAGYIAGIAAIGVALFPTAPDGATSTDTIIIGYIHLGFAAIFFLALIYFSLFLFTKTNPDKTPTKRKLQRNRVYRVCGYTMALCILLVVIYFLLPGETAIRLKTLRPVYWLEAIAIVSFGVSWLVKGEAILKNEV